MRLFKVAFFTSFPVLLLFAAGCSTAYKAKPMSFKPPASYGNEVTVDGAQVGARAYVNKEEAEKAFGFNVIGAGMLPVQVVIDNRGSHILKINGSQSFLEDDQGNLWPVLDKNTAYDRATKYATTKQTFEQGAAKGLLGAVAGSVIGAAIGVVTGGNVGETTGMGAAAGGAFGAISGGASGYNSVEAQQTIISDLRQKSLQNKDIDPGMLAQGILFFPAEAKTAKRLRLQLIEPRTGKTMVVDLLL